MKVKHLVCPIMGLEKLNIQYVEKNGGAVIEDKVSLEALKESVFFRVRTSDDLKKDMYVEIPLYELHLFDQEVALPDFGFATYQVVWVSKAALKYYGVQKIAEGLPEMVAKTISLYEVMSSYSAQ